MQIKSYFYCMKKKSLYVVLLLLVSFFLFTASHPLYLSICQIDHNAENKSLEVSVRIFDTDIIEALEAKGVKNIHLGTASELDGLDSLIANYIQENIQIAVEGKKVAGNFLGKEVEGDVVWSYVEFLNVPSVSSIQVKNTLLFELFDSQQNIVHVKVNGKTRSLRLHIGEKSGEIEFD